MASSPISTAQVPGVKPILNSIPEEERSRYGIRMMEVLATNNPTDSCLFNYVASGSTYPAHKKIFTVRNPEFSRVYENKMHDAIVKILLLSLPEECQWSLHVLRMGFHEDQMANPIVAHLLVPP